MTADTEASGASATALGCSQRHSVTQTLTCSKNSESPCLFPSSLRGSQLPAFLGLLTIWVTHGVCQAKSGGGRSMTPLPQAVPGAELVVWRARPGLVTVCSTERWPEWWASFCPPGAACRHCPGLAGGAAGLPGASWNSHFQLVD